MRLFLVTSVIVGLIFAVVEFIPDVFESVSSMIESTLTGFFMIKDLISNKSSRSIAYFLLHI